jgi:hypothetical protein
LEGWCGRGSFELDGKRSWGCRMMDMGRVYGIC